VAIFLSFFLQAIRPFRHPTNKVRVLSDDLSG